MNDDMVRVTAVESLKDHLPFDGYKVTTELVCEVLLHAAVNNKTIEASCQDLAPQVSSSALREQLHNHINSGKISELEQSINSILRDRLLLQSHLPRNADFHRVSYLKAARSIWAKTRLSQLGGIVELPRRVRRGQLDIAIDLHDQPFYGQDDEWVCRGEAKAGTTRFYRVATAYLPGSTFHLGS